MHVTSNWWVHKSDSCWGIWNVWQLVARPTYNFPWASGKDPSKLCFSSLDSPFFGKAVREGKYGYKMNSDLQHHTSPLPHDACKIPSWYNRCLKYKIRKSLNMILYFTQSSYCQYFDGAGIFPLIIVWTKLLSDLVLCSWRWYPVCIGGERRARPPPTNKKKLWKVMQDQHQYDNIVTFWAFHFISITKKI